MFISLKIMDLSQVILLTISLTFTFFSDRALAGTLSGSKKDRYNGYDLQRGPVFYEAYYADDQPPTTTDQNQRIFENTKTETQHSSRGNIIENTYQIPGNFFYVASHEQNARQNEEQKVFDAPREIEKYENPSNRRATNEAKELKKFAENLRQDISLNDYPAIDDSDYISIRGDMEKKINLANPYSQWKSELLIKKEDLPDEKIDSYMNAILSAIKSSALEILQEGVKKVSENRDESDRNTIILRHPRFVGSEDSTDRRVLEMKDFPKNSFTRSSKELGLGIQESGIEDWAEKLYEIRESGRMNDLVKSRDENNAQSSISRMSYPIENILQPRPQIINYVFRPTNMLAKERLLSLMMQPMRQIPASQSALSNDKPETNNRNNFTNEISTANKRLDEMAPKVASIEVTEITRHKIRHHHGEKQRRNHHRRHIEAGP